MALALFAGPAVARLAALGALGVASIAAAQWTVTNVTPAGAQAFLYGISDGQQVGQVSSTHSTAALWSGSAESFTDFGPAGAATSTAFACWGSQQVGSATFGSAAHASLWTGSPGSLVDLNPAGASSSVAYGVSGGQQVGVAFVPGAHASLWSGTAASWADLHPAGMDLSEALAAYGGQQVGFIRRTRLDSPEAALWSGSAASFISLNPSGRTSQALAIWGGHQVGQVDGRAALWSGSAQSWVDLGPAGAFQSAAMGVFGDIEVGRAAVGVWGRNYHASLWNSTAESWFDLSTVLPGSWGDTYAQGVWADGTTLYIAGGGFNNDTQRNEALIWSRPIPAPGTLAALAIVALSARGAWRGRKR